MGSQVNRTSLQNRLELTKLLLSDEKWATATVHQIQQALEEKTGIRVSESTVYDYRKATYPDVVRKRTPGSKTTSREQFDELISKVLDIEARLARLDVQQVMMKKDMSRLSSIVEPER